MSFKEYFTILKNNMKAKIRPICKECANKLNLKPKFDFLNFMLSEPCADCGKIKPTLFTDYLEKK